jgi:hypothetical protein
VCAAFLHGWGYPSFARFYVDNVEEVLLHYGIRTCVKRLALPVRSGAVREGAEEAAEQATA